MFTMFIHAVCALTVMGPLWRALLNHKWFGMFITLTHVAVCRGPALAGGPPRASLERVVFGVHNIDARCFLHLTVVGRRWRALLKRVIFGLHTVDSRWCLYSGHGEPAFGWPEL